GAAERAQRASSGRAPGVNLILILDFGSQYTQLIARRVRELRVYCEIHPFDLPLDALRRMAPAGVILSGGPASVYAEGAPLPARDVLELLMTGAPPVLGICYGMNVLGQAVGGEVRRANRKEFGPADLRITRFDPLLALGGRSTRVWMSHGDQMASLPGAFETLAASDNSPHAAFRHRERPIYGLQFHPEVTHSVDGREILRNFVLRVFRDTMELDVRHVDAAARFLENLREVEDPERKRRTIGVTFIEVFEEEARQIPDAAFLAQGTLYPDVIESVSVRGPSATIKSHHNVGGLPERMRLELLEPLRELFKDEVRDLGRVLGVPEEIVARQPFPGPGLAVRIVGPVDAERLAILRGADAIVQEEIRSAGLYGDLWQAFAVLLPVKTVGVMGDERTYENVIAIRAVTSTDGMTADWARLPGDLLARLSSRIINEVQGVNRVVYDISSKPPATIEWE